MLLVPKTKNGNGRAHTVERFKISRAIVPVSIITITLSGEINKPQLLAQVSSKRKNELMNALFINDPQVLNLS